MAEETEVVQPVEGQGDGGQSDAPYAEYLNRIPEEVRGDVEPVFKEWDANTTRKFQEHSEYRRSWEPYEQAGINQYDPHALAEHLQMLQDPAQVVEWARAIAEQNGIPLAPEQQQQQTPPEFQYDQGYQDPQAEQVKQMLQEHLSPLQQQVQQFAQWQQQQEQERAVQYGQSVVDRQMDEIKKSHPDANITEETQDWLEGRAMKYVQTDPDHCMLRAWEDLQRMRNDIEKQALQKKVGAPDPAEGGGVPDVSLDKAKSLQDPSLAATAAQILRNSRAA